MSATAGTFTHGSEFEPGRLGRHLLLRQTLCQVERRWLCALFLKTKTFIYYKANLAIVWEDSLCQVEGLYYFFFCFLNYFLNKDKNNAIIFFVMLVFSFIFAYCLIHLTSLFSNFSLPQNLFHLIRLNRIFDFYHNPSSCRHRLVVLQPGVRASFNERVCACNYSC